MNKNKLFGWQVELLILINKWKTERNKLLSKLSFCSEHKFNLEVELIRHKIKLLGSFIFDLEYCLK